MILGFRICQICCTLQNKSGTQLIYNILQLYSVQYYSQRNQLAHNIKLS